MRTISFLLLLTSFSSAAIAECASSQLAEQAAIQQLYADREVVNYICGPTINCSVEGFTAMLDISPVALSPGLSRPDGLEVAPKNKGLVYFTAIFLAVDCSYKLVFYPDLSSSGVKISREIRNGKYVVVSMDRDSRSEWSETEYLFDSTNIAYRAGKTKCFAEIAGRVAPNKCE